MLRYIYGFINLLAFGIFCTVSIVDLIYVYPVSNGTSANILYSFAWWCILIFTIINFIQPLSLIGIYSASTLDFHSAFSFVCLGLNFLAIILCTVCYLFYMNTSYANGFPFNDYKWCCLYFGQNQNLCPNTNFCTTDPMSLYANDQFIILWIFSGIFFLNSAVHLALHILIVKAQIVPPPTIDEAKRMAYTIAIVSLILFAYWAAFPLLDTQFIYGYPTMGVPPGPGIFQSYRYTFWQWWFVWFLLTNLGPPLILIGILSFEYQNIYLTAAHFWANMFTGIITSASFFAFLVILIFDCNYGWSGGSICNSHLWCCSYFSGSYDICGNVTPCPSNPNLYPSAEFIQHLVISLIFAAIAYGNLWLNDKLKKYGIFY